MANIASISTSQSGKKTSVEPSLSSSANHGGSLYNLPCTILTGAQSFAKKTSQMLQANIPTTSKSNTFRGRRISYDVQNIQQKSQPSATDHSATGKKKLNFLLHQNKMLACKHTEEDQNNSETIVTEMLTACEEDNAGYYFDEFGGGLEGMSSKKHPWRM